MKFDPRTEAKIEQEELEEKLQDLAKTCALLNRIFQMTLNDNSDVAESCQVAFEDIWQEAMKITDSRKFYELISKAEKA